MSGCLPVGPVALSGSQLAIAVTVERLPPLEAAASHQRRGRLILSSFLDHLMSLLFFTELPWRLCTTAHRSQSG